MTGAIGKALGKQGEKVLFAIREMKQHHIQYTKQIKDQSYNEAFQSAQMYNNARTKAIKARWELLQAVGFTVDNHSVVHDTYNIGEQLPTRLEDIVDECGEPKRQNHDVDESTKKKKWGDQLSWWQRVGRWK